LVSQEAVFKLIYNAATCFIPTNELTEEQLDKLDNITYHGCTCRLCRGGNALGHPDGMALGHADRMKLKICWSKPFFSVLLTQEMSMSATLFAAVDTILHEIIHILFPEYDEEETRQKTCEWLKRNLWLESHRQFTCLSKSDLTEMGYSLKK
jgi:hypothetical protein